MQHPKLVTFTDENGKTQKAFSFEETIEIADNISFIEAIDLGYFDIKYTNTIVEDNGERKIIYEFDYN